MKSSKHLFEWLTDAGRTRRKAKWSSTEYSHSKASRQSCTEIETRIKPWVNENWSKTEEILVYQCVGGKPIGSKQQISPPSLLTYSKIMRLFGRSDRSLQKTERTDENTLSSDQRYPMYKNASTQWPVKTGKALIWITCGKMRDHGHRVEQSRQKQQRIYAQMAAEQDQLVKRAGQATQNRMGVF